MGTVHSWSPCHCGHCQLWWGITTNPHMAGRQQSKTQYLSITSLLYYRNTLIIHNDRRQPQSQATRLPPLSHHHEVSRLTTPHSDWLVSKPVKGWSASWPISIFRLVKRAWSVTSMSREMLARAQGSSVGLWLVTRPVREAQSPASRDLRSPLLLL